MILGTTTVYQCDGNGCETTKVVPVELEPQFSLDWHNGLTHQFCATCKNHFRNQAAIVNDERAAAQFRMRAQKHAA